MTCILKTLNTGFALTLVITLLSTIAHGQSSLQRALTQGDVAKIRTLVGNDSKLLAMPLVSTRMAPLHFAIQQGKLELVKLLLELGAPLDDKNPQKLTALHSALIRGNQEIFELILEKTDNVDAGDRNGSSRLCRH